MVDSETTYLLDISSTSNKMPEKKYQAEQPNGLAAHKWLVLLWGEMHLCLEEEGLGESTAFLLSFQGGYKIKGEKGELVHLTGCQQEQTYSREKHGLIQWCKFTEGFGSLEEKTACEVHTELLGLWWVSLLLLIVVTKIHLLLYATEASYEMHI